MLANVIFIVFSGNFLDGSVALFKDDKPMTIPVQIMGLRVTKAGWAYKINLELIGLTINWDAEHLIHVEATAALFNRTAGLCGTLDQDPTNDFASKDGTVHKVFIYIFILFFLWRNLKRIFLFCQSDLVDDINIHGCLANTRHKL